MELEALKGWENFYVVTGSAAAGLTGLTFVVIALVRDARSMNPAGLGAFVSPTIVHFTVVLTLAAFLCVPRMSTLGVELGLIAFGLAGVLYIASIAFKIATRVADYLPVLEDWAFNVILPGTSYGALFGMGLLIARRPGPALDGVAGASVLLLLVGIHNAWDIAVWMSLRAQREATREASRAGGADASGGVGGGGAGSGGAGGGGVGGGGRAR
jgi:uncharacterized membrane protein YgcG